MSCVLSGWQVTEGLDVLDSINETYVDDAGRPFQNIRYAAFSVICESGCWAWAICVWEGGWRREDGVFDEIDLTIRLQHSTLPFCIALSVPCVALF